jgi:RNA polymerase sigma-70 factor (ECF subfamily)
MVPSHPEDLALAEAARRGDPQAVHRVTVELLDEAARAVMRLHPSSDFVEEVKQSLRERLLVSTAERPAKLQEYTGQGPLLKWLRVVCVGTAINLRRGDRREHLVDEVAELEQRAAPEDLELDFIKARDGAVFKAAFAEAFASLSVEARNVLRLSVLEGLSIDQLGTLYGVHRATAARWLSKAKETLAERARELAAERLRLQQPELESLMRVIRSQLDVSLHRLLREG